MPAEPTVKRTVAFVDGQNLFYAVREAFGYTYPNYDVGSLAASICNKRDWRLSQIRFYTGIPDQNANPRWHSFWQRKLAVMGTRNVWTFTRPLRYRNEMAVVDGLETSVLVGREKGIDVRIALDVMRLAHRNEFDVALIFSQDQDLSEVADEVKATSIEHQRWIKVASVFPVSPTYDNARGINGTDWIRLDRATYDSCIDRNDYRQKEEKT